uniref:Uncharacterized protein n=1 Tax=Magnetococcus massalia (strain MO-1) TaxID=451514 RepID=A0A1S7LMX6_MAGMO|nr:Conserved membrane protein of unknown function [Candidatus Magnetococcus massalia]
MILQPSVLALLVADGVAVLFLAMATLFALRLLKGWDLGSGSALQLQLERRTYLVSTLLTFALATQLIALLLLVFNADRMSEYFVGAMCAVGSFNAHPWGFPALMLRLGLFFLAGTWLVTNYLDNQHPRYPLIRPKYALILPTLLLAVTTGGLQLGYFLGLEGDLSAVITSCCGALFSVDAKTVASELSGSPPDIMMGIFYLTMALVVGGGIWVSRSHRGFRPLALLGVAALVVGIAAVISFISLYLYEHPHHHCPFCLLKPEYNYFGYLLYIPLFLATALNLGVGFSSQFLRGEVREAILPIHGAKLIRWTVVLYLLFTLFATLAVVQSNLILLES